MNLEIDYLEIYNDWKDSLEIKDNPNEWEVKKLMRLAGLPVPQDYLLRNDNQLVDSNSLFSIMGSIRNPYVIKVCSATILHKTDVGGVVLDVSKGELMDAIEMLRKQFPGEHLLISPMIRVRGPEYILGAILDPVFGPSVMVGAGGILTELYRDVTFRLAPCTEEEAGRMLRDLTISPVLTGFRGSTMNIKKLQSIISRFSCLTAQATREGVQFDINPLVWNGEDWIVLDAKAVFKNVSK